MKGRVLLNIVFFVSVANFLAFCAISEVIGGDAINGYAEHGRYFLRSHGRTTEVSEAVFAYSKWHAIPTLFSTKIVSRGRRLRRSPVLGLARCSRLASATTCRWHLEDATFRPSDLGRWRAYPHEPAPRGSEAKPGSACRASHA